MRVHAGEPQALDGSIIMLENESHPAGKYSYYLPKAMELFESVTRKPPLPEVLHHYTTGDGLLGIVRTKKIWATNVRYMNDESELEYARELVNSELRAATGRCKNLAKPLLAGFPAVLDGVFASNEHYAACFCESGDLLSQWRAYGAGGFALAFGAAALSRLIETPIIRIEYDPELQKSSVRKTIDIHMLEIEKAVDEQARERIPEISGQFAFMLALWTTAFKHPTFAEEREWRMIPLMLPTPTLFRSERGWLKPYIEIPLVGDDARMDLRAVTHAPSPNPELAKRSLRLLLENSDQRDVMIRGSSVPLRP